MRSTSIVIALAFGSLFFAGCIHTRTSAFTSVGGEVQKLKTRNRYTLVGFKHQAQNPNADVVKENLYTQQFSTDNLKKFQPDVFADDGIRFTVSQRRLPDEGIRYQWTQYFPFLLTLTALPQCVTTSYSSQYRVDVLDNPDARATFNLHGRYDYATALLTPAPLLCYMGDAAPPEDESQGQSVVSRHGVGFAGAINFGTYVFDVQNIYSESEAYALAATLKKMEDDGLIDELRGKTAGRDAAQILSLGDKFEIIDFRKDDDSGSRYSFSLRHRGGGGIQLRESREVQKMLKAMIREDYVSSFPDVAAETIVVDFPEFSLRGGMVRGKSEVLSFAVESLRYDPHTRVGLMRVRIGENQFEAARRYARRNIESLVRDKNIALDGRDIPPAATFYLRSETLKGNTLEITFKTE